MNKPTVMTLKNNSSIKNEKGILTLDLIFGLSLALGGMIIVFALCMTLSAIEIAQYVAFSTSRDYLAGHVNESAQRSLAGKKYSELVNSPAFKNFFRKGWFELTPVNQFRNGAIGDYKSEYDDVITGSYSPFFGTEVRLQAKLLSFNVPFFGPTTSSDQGLSTRVNSYLGREPTAEECINMTAQRWNSIKQEAANSNSGFVPTGAAYYLIVDDGC